MRSNIEPSPSARPPRPPGPPATPAASDPLGTLLSRPGSEVSSAAAISGRAAFLEPLTHRSPASCEPPVMRSANSRCVPGSFITGYGTCRTGLPIPDGLAKASPSGAPRMAGRRLGSSGPRKPEPGFRNGERVLELDLLSRCDGAGELFLGAAPRLLSPLDRDLVGMLRHVGEHCDTVGQHLEEAAAHEEDLLVALGDADLQRPGLEDRHEGRVTSEHAELAVGAVGHDELHVAFEEAALNAHDAKWELHPTTPPLASSSSRPAHAPLRWSRPCRRPARAGHRACPRGSLRSPGPYQRPSRTCPRAR